MPKLLSEPIKFHLVGRFSGYRGTDGLNTLLNVNNTKWAKYFSITGPVSLAKPQKDTVHDGKNGAFRITHGLKCVELDFVALFIFDGITLQRILNSDAQCCKWRAYYSHGYFVFKYLFWWKFRHKAFEYPTSRWQSSGEVRIFSGKLLMGQVIRRVVKWCLWFYYYSIYYVWKKATSVKVFDFESSVYTVLI